VKDRKLEKIQSQIRKIANDTHLEAQLIMQNYCFERFLERISLSIYKDHFILKGGFLISALVGVHNRATMDIDATLKSYPLERESLEKLLADVVAIRLDDGMNFEIQWIKDIRVEDEYSGYRTQLLAIMGKMRMPLKIDISTGDVITPQEIEYPYKLMLEDRTLSIMAYNLETVIAEKLECIITRAEFNTRARDYYDTYILWKLKKDKIDMDVLKSALSRTTTHRQTASLMDHWQTTLTKIETSKELKAIWGAYQNKFEYANGIEIEDIFEIIKIILYEVTIG
jgi:predicted nucleotidyltransferase component of viral defense system